MATPSTTNYDAVAAALNLQDAPEGLLIHTAGFDLDAGLFRIFDVWETRAHGEKFIDERLDPIIKPLIAAAAENPDARSTRRAVKPGTNCTTPSAAEAISLLGPVGARRLGR